LWFGNNTVVVIIGILSAIAKPSYSGQQAKAKDAAAMAQLRTAATSQQLYYVQQNAYAGTTTDLEAYGFRQGGARGDGRVRGCQHVLHGGSRRCRHVQDHPGHGQARTGHMLEDLPWEPESVLAAPDGTPPEEMALAHDFR